MPSKKQKAKRGAALEIAAAIFLALLVTAALLLMQRNAASPANPPSQAMTLAPEVAANLNALPSATPLSGEAAAAWNDFREQVNACDEYSTERRQQMNQHIDWLIDPSDMPPDVIIAMGANPRAQLIFGMAGYTSTEWRRHERPADSCLRDIGLLLNDLLVEAGREPFTIYQDPA